MSERERAPRARARYRAREDHGCGRFER
jgi:hypothetical protein